jgi:hypothetical protein
MMRRLDIALALGAAWVLISSVLAQGGAIEFITPRHLLLPPA